LKVLVAGSTGTIGVPLVRALLADGHHVDGLARRPSGKPLPASLGAEPVVADALDRDMAQTNLLRTRGTAHLLEAATAIGAHRSVADNITAGAP
jgi:nucleoside-diphosphate-sugar epimerase